MVIISGLSILVLVALGGYLLFFGVRGLIEKKPRLIPMRHFMWGLIVCCVLIAIVLLDYVSFSLLIEHIELDIPYILGMSMVPFSVLLFLFTVQFSVGDSYTIVGIADTSFRSALIHALNALDFAFEETILRIRLTEIKADLVVAVNSSMGTAQLNIKQKQHRALLKPIAESMKRYFGEFPAKTILFVYTLDTMLGVILVLAALLFGFILFNVSVLYGPSFLRL